MVLTYGSVARHVRCVFVVALAAACGGLVAACGGSEGDGGGITEPTPPPLAITIRTPNEPPPRFIPVISTMAAGGEVTWKSQSPVEHNLVATTTNWQLNQPLPAGARFTTTIAQPGAYGFKCTIHEGMSGSITVK